MGFRSYNANPDDNRVGDCTIRAISSVLCKSWGEVFAGICVIGYIMHDMPSSDAVWGQYLRMQGFQRYVVPCRDDPCTVADFCRDHPNGVYLLAVKDHVISVVYGDWYDTWDSGEEYPIYYWAKED